MTPAQFARQLRLLQARAATAPMAVESALRATAARNAPRGVSVVVTHTGSGTRVLLSGPGARRYARTLGRRLGPVAAAAVRGVVR